VQVGVAHYLQTGWGGQCSLSDSKLPTDKGRHVTKVFAIAGLDVRAIGSKSLYGFSSGLTLIIKRQMLSSTIKQKSASVQA